MLQLTWNLRCPEASSSSPCRDATEATDLPWPSQAVGSQSACTSPSQSRGALNGRSFPGQWQARHLTGRALGPEKQQRGEEGSVKHLAKPTPSHRASCPYAQPPCPPEATRETVPVGAPGVGRRFWLGRGSRLFLLPTLSLHGPKLSRKPPQGVVSRHSAFGVNAAGQPELSSRRAAAAVTHREDAHADWGLQQARHLEPSHRATAGAGAGAGTFDKELLGQRKAPSAESQASRREHTTL